MATYEYACAACGAHFDLARSWAEATEPAPCPVCGENGRRVFTMPKLLFKADPRDVRPYWHNHDGYSHQHAPRRGRHRFSSEEH